MFCTFGTIKLELASDVYPVVTGYIDDIKGEYFDNFSEIVRIRYEFGFITKYHNLEVTGNYCIIKGLENLATIETEQKIELKAYVG